MRIFRGLVLAAFTAGLIGFAGSTPAAALAAGQTITFGESPGSGLGQYTAIGVTFGSGPFGIVPGISQGDPGGWSLEGTNDSWFMGFNGGTYAVEVTLDENVGGVSLDASRSGGSSDGTVTLEALQGATVVDTDTAVLGAINSWSTLSVAGPLDGFRITGTGSGFHPYGVDNIALSGAPNTAPVADAGPTQDVQLSAATSSVDVTLDGSASGDADSDPLTYTWTGDFTGGTANGATPIVTFTSAGIHTVTLEVNDGTDTDSATVDIVVAAAPTTATTSPTTPPPSAPAADAVVATPDYTG
jgi:hypothetical protein